MCFYNMTLVEEPVLPSDPQGCITGQFWDYSDQECKDCYYTCGSCEGFESYCLTCVQGKYLTEWNTCEECESWWKQDMVSIQSYPKDGWH